MRPTRQHQPSFTAEGILPVCRRRGFALVTSLVLMGMLSILMVAAASLVMVERVRVENDLAQWQARQNAVLGFKIAFATLQREAGPDQRVSARADILGVDAADVGIVTGKRHWTGIWRTSSGGVLLPPVWLVSGVGESSPTAPWISSAPQPVVLSHGNSADRSNAVWVEPETLRDHTGQAQGRFAWWVGDEGTKANVGLQGRDPGGIYRSQYMRRFGVEYSGDPMVSAYYSADWFEEGEGPVTLARMQSVGDLYHMGSSAAEPNSFESTIFTDLTVFSKGVMANTSSGGLKKDLSFGLAQEQPMNPSDPANYLWQLDLSSGESWPVPSWELLRQWYRLPLDYPQLAKNPEAEMPVLSIGEAGRGEARTAPAVHPLLIYASTTYGISLIPEGESFRIWITIKPVFALWNPWDVAISAANYTIIGPHGGGGAPAILFDAQGGRGIQFTYTDHTDTFFTSNNQQLHALRFQLDGPAFYPGEVVWFSLTDTVVPYSVPDRDGRGPELESGFRPHHFTAFPIVARTPAGDYPSDYEEGVDRFLLTAEEVAADPNFILRVRGGSRAWHLFVDSESGNRIKLQRLVTQNLRPSSALFALSQILEDDVPSDPIDMVSAAQYFVAPSSTGGWRGRTNLIRSGNIRARRLNHLGESHTWEYGFHPFGATAPFLGHGHEQGFHFSEDNLWGSQAGFVNPESAGSLSGPIFFHLPRQPWFSLGQLQHVDFGATAYDSSYPFANSFASPYIDPRTSQREIRNFSNSTLRDLIQDYSYLANSALWDGYFFSTRDYSQPEAWQLANPRMLVIDADFNEVVDPGESRFELPQTVTSASNLLVDGAFNINSTSVAAWRSLLGSMNNASQTTRNPINGELNATAVRSSPSFPRLPSPSRIQGSTGEGRINPWHDLKTLTEAQIDTLAGQIVYRIRQRGRPFGSLAEFVNRDLQAERSPHDPDDPALRGILQRSIDSYSAVTLDPSDETGAATYSWEGEPINPQLNDGTVYGSQIVDFGDEQASPEQTNWVREATVGLTSEGAPGWLTQADILTAIAPFIAARSDTFLIRFQGETIAKAGLQSAVVRGEAIVQRMPDYVESSSPPHEEASGLNATFGRRFQVIAFRWINE